MNEAECVNRCIIGGCADSGAVRFSASRKNAAAARGISL